MEQIEIWKDVKGFEGIYKLSNLGNVKRIIFKTGVNTKYKNDYTLKPLDNGLGYFRIKLTKNNISKRYMLHRLIAEAFIPNEENKRCVNHINGNKKDNSIQNLEWCTHKENTIHAVKNGLFKVNAKQHINSKKVLNIDTGFIYDSIAHASRVEKLDRGYLSERLNGKAYNNTNLVFH